MTTKQPMVSQLEGIVRIFAKSVKDASEHAEGTAGTLKNMKSKSALLARYNHNANALQSFEDSEDRCQKKNITELMTDKRHKMEISHSKNVRSCRSLEKSKTLMPKAGNKEKSVFSKTDLLMSKPDADIKSNRPLERRLSTCSSKSGESDKHRSSTGSHSAELKATSSGLHDAETKVKPVNKIDKKGNSLKYSFFGSEDWTSELLDQSVIESAYSCKQLTISSLVSENYGCTSTKDCTNFFSSKDSVCEEMLTSCVDQSLNCKQNIKYKLSKVKKPLIEKSEYSWTSNSKDANKKSMSHLKGSDSLEDKYDSCDGFDMATNIHADAFTNEKKHRHSKKLPSYGTIRLTSTSTLPNQKFDIGGGGDTVDVTQDVDKINQEMNLTIKHGDGGMCSREAQSQKSLFVETQNTSEKTENTQTNDEMTSIKSSNCNSLHQREPAKLNTSNKQVLCDYQYIRDSINDTITVQCSSDKYYDQCFHSSKEKNILEMKLTYKDTFSDVPSVEDVNLQEDKVFMPSSQEDWSDDLINTSIPVTVPSHLPDLDYEDYEAESQTDSAGNFLYSLETLSSVDQDFMQAVYSQEDDSEKIGMFPNSTHKADNLSASDKPICIYDAHVDVDKDLEVMKNIAQQQLNQVYSVSHISDYEIDSDYSDSELFYDDHKLVKSSFITSEDPKIVSSNLSPKEHHTESSSSDYDIKSVNVNQTPEAPKIPDSTDTPVSPKQIFDQKLVLNAGDSYSLTQSFKENGQNSAVSQSQICRHGSDEYHVQPQKLSPDSTSFPGKHLSTAIYPDGINQNHCVSFAEPTKVQYNKPSHHYSGSHFKSSSPRKEYGFPMWSTNRSSTSWEHKLSDMVLCIPLKDIQSQESHERMFDYVKNVLQLIGESQNSNITKDSKVLLRTVFNGESYDLNVGIVGHRASFCPFSDSSVSSNFQNQHSTSSSQGQILEVTMEHDTHEPQKKIGRGSGLQKIVTGYSDDNGKSRHDGCNGNNLDECSVQSFRQSSNLQRECDNADKPSAKTLPCAGTSQVHSDSLMKRIWSKILPGKHQCSVQTISGVKRSHLNHVDHADKSVGPSDSKASWIRDDKQSGACESKTEMELNRCPNCASCLCCKHKHIVIPKKSSPKLEDSEVRTCFHDVKNVNPPLDINGSKKEKGPSLFDYRNPNYYGMPYPFWMARAPPPYTESMVMYPGMPQWIYPYSYPNSSPSEHLPVGSESASSSSLLSPNSPPTSVPASKSEDEKCRTENKAPISSSPRSPDTNIWQSTEHTRRKRFQRKFQESKSNYPTSYSSEYTQSPVSKSCGCSPLLDRSLSNNNLLTFDWKEKFKKKYGGYSVPFIDSHCHLDLLFDREGFQGTFTKYRQLHKDTFPDNFFGCVAVFCNPASFVPEGGLWKDMAMDYKSTIYLAMGCHPKNAFNFDSAAYNNLKACLLHPRVVACGEIGLDYSGTFYHHKEQQMEVFAQQLKLALEVKKPIVIHCREAEDDCLEIMEKIVPRNYTIHCHCFTGNYLSCQKWLNKFPKLFVGLTPVITYVTAKPAQEVAKYIPLERLLLETDAPYFVPSTVPRNQQPVSHPGMAIAVAVQVALLKDVSVSMVLSHCFRNTKTMYGISCNTF